MSAELPGSDPRLRAWINVRPLDGSRYSVWYYEVEKSRYEEVLDSLDYDKPGMLLNSERVTVVGDEELRDTLLRRLDDLTKLTDPGLSSAPV
jgi:hypothetical protein